MHTTQQTCCYQIFLIYEHDLSNLKAYSNGTECYLTGPPPIWGNCVYHYKVTN